MSFGLAVYILLKFTSFANGSGSVHPPPVRFNLREWRVAIHFMYYNFGRIHKTLRITPAMAAGISDHVWSYDEIAELAR